MSSSVSGVVNLGVLKSGRGRAGARGAAGTLCGRAETPAETASVADKKEVLMID